MISVFMLLLLLTTLASTAMEKPRKRFNSDAQGLLKKEKEAEGPSKMTLSQSQTIDIKTKKKEKADAPAQMMSEILYYYKNGIVNSLAYGAGKKTLVFCGNDENDGWLLIRNLKIPDFSVTYERRVDKTPLCALAYLQNRGEIIAGSTGPIKIFNETARNLGVLEGHEKVVTAILPLTCDPLSKHDRIASSSDDATIRLWDLESKKNTATLKNGMPIYCLEDIGTNKIVSGDSSGDTKVWDLVTQKIVTNKPKNETAPKHIDAVSCLAFIEDRKLLASGGADYKIQLIDLEKAKSVKTLAHHSIVTAIKYLGNDKIVSAGGHDREIRLWDIRAKNKPINVLKGHDDCVTCVDYMPETKCVISGSWDGTVQYWQLEGEK